MALGKLGFNCCKKCGAGPCDCEGWLPDNMKLHVVGRSQSAQFGLNRAMSALCSHNSTSRLVRNHPYQIQRNVTVGNDFYSKRLIFDYPYKTAQKVWLGCMTESYGVPTGWGRAGHRYWDSNPKQFSHPLRQQYTPSIFDSGEITHVMQKGESNFKPEFFFLDRGNLLEREEIHGAVFTQVQNSKLNFYHKHKTMSRCNWWQEWGFCGWCIRFDLRFNSEYLSTWLPIYNTTTTQSQYKQQEISSGTARGFRPFSFVPATGSTGWISGVPISFNLRTQATVNVGLVNNITFQFDYSEFHQRAGIWTLVLRAIGEVQLTLPSMCADNLTTPMQIFVFKYAGFGPPTSMTTHNCNLVMNYEVF